MQADGITKELLRTMARAQGVNLPEQRLDAVLSQYQSYLQSLARMESLPLSREAEPEILEELLEPCRHPYGTRLLFDPREVTKRASRGHCRVRFGLPALDLIACLLREVKTKLVVEIAVRPCREGCESDQRSNAGPQHDPS